MGNQQNYEFIVNAFFVFYYNNNYYYKVLAKFYNTNFVLIIY